MAFVGGGMVVLYPTPPPEGSKIKKPVIGVQEIFFRAPLGNVHFQYNHTNNGREIKTDGHRCVRAAPSS